MKKRLFSFALAVLFTLSAFSFGALADDNDVGTDIGQQYSMLVAVDSVSVSDDATTVDVNVSVERNGGFAAMTYQLLYDTDALVLEESPRLAERFAGANFTSAPIGEGKHTGMLWSPENLLGDGTVVTYTFSIKEEAKSGFYEISVITDGKAVQSNGTEIELMLLDENFDRIVPVTKNGGVTIPGYTVTYDANGGENAPESQEKSRNDFVYLSSKTPVRDGYKFVGWSTSATGSAEYLPGDKYTDDANLDLYAVWEKQEIVAGSIDIALSTAEAKAGDEVEITVSVNEHLGFNGLSFDVIYDNTKLDYLSYRQDMLFSGLFEVSAPDRYENKVNFQILAGAQNVVETGALVTLKFKVLDTAEDGFTELTLVPDEAFCLYGPNMADATLTTNVTGGGVEISSQLTGDINLDEIVNSDDAVLLLQHLLFGEAVFPIEYNGTLDFNKDGIENSDDAIRLLQYALFGDDMFPIE